MFIKNCWYVAAWSHEVGANDLLARTIIGVPAVFWRHSDGHVVAFEDRCCHRGAPLSIGRREGDSLRCMYHGMLFDGSGACIDIPCQEKIPPGTRVRSLPVVERNRWIWVWMGAPAQADAASIPELPWLSDPAWLGVRKPWAARPATHECGPR
jgi:vanillate O-demethylase monooxygenase subunit